MSRPTHDDQSKEVQSLRVLFLLNYQRVKANVIADVLERLLFARGRERCTLELDTGAPSAPATAYFNQIFTTF